jgi:hypothetical protein
MNRRNFLKSGLALVAAPAIVKAENIMRIATPREVQVVADQSLSFDEFVKQIMIATSRAMGIPFEELARDYHGAVCR